MQVIAHRGASKAERENTVAAFRLAASMGADAVERDVRRSRDGVLVVHHDAHVPVGDALVALCDLDHVDIPGHVPTLAAAIDACAGMWVNVEIKNAATEPGFESDDAIAVDTAALLMQHSTPQRWVISSFRIDTIDRARAAAPTLRTAWLTTPYPEDVIEQIAGRGHAAWHPNARLLSAEMVARAHAVGLAVNTWTVDRPERLAELIAWGVDGVCTNVPDVAVRVRASARAPMTD
jgi:glycerophosphoryl diester phosphodiesterase